MAVRAGVREVGEAPVAAHPLLARRPFVRLLDREGAARQRLARQLQRPVAACRARPPRTARRRSRWRTPCARSPCSGCRRAGRRSGKARDSLAATQVAGAITRSQYVRHWRHSEASVRRAVRPIGASLPRAADLDELARVVSNTPCFSALMADRVGYGLPTSSPLFVAARPLRRRGGRRGRAGPAPPRRRCCSGEIKFPRAAAHDDPDRRAGRLAADRRAGLRRQVQGRRARRGVRVATSRPSRPCACATAASTPR